MKQVFRLGQLMHQVICHARSSSVAMDKGAFEFCTQGKLPHIAFCPWIGAIMDSLRRVAAKVVRIINRSYNKPGGKPLPGPWELFIWAGYIRGVT